MIKLGLLHIMLFGLLLAGYWFGFTQVLWAADKLYAIPIIWMLTTVGVWMVSRNALEGATWLADKLPVVGLGLTVIGLLWASNGDIGSDAFKRDVLHSLVGNLAGVAGYAWIELCAKVVKDAK